MAGSGDRENRILSEQVGPREGFDRLEELIEGARRKATHRPPYPVGAAQPEVGSAQKQLVAREPDTAIFVAGLDHAQGLQLPGDHAFQAKGTSRAQVHSRAPSKQAW